MRSISKRKVREGRRWNPELRLIHINEMWEEDPSGELIRKEANLTINSGWDSLWKVVDMYTDLNDPRRIGLIYILISLSQMCKRRSIKCISECKRRNNPHSLRR